jgi:hypothetical protein
VQTRALTTEPKIGALPIRQKIARQRLLFGRDRSGLLNRGGMLWDPFLKGSRASLAFWLRSA